MDEKKKQFKLFKSIKKINQRNNLNKTHIWKEMFYSITKFELYGKFALENVVVTIKYLLQMVLLVAFFMALVNTYSNYTRIKSAIDYYQDNIYKLDMKEYVLEVNDNQELKIYPDIEILDEIIIDTDDLNEDKIEDYKKELKGNSNGGILFLKDKCVLIGYGEISYTYKEFSETYNLHLSEINKTTLLALINSRLPALMFFVFILSYVGIFSLKITDILINAMMLALLCSVLSRIAKIKISLKSCFGISIHAQTLPLWLAFIFTTIEVFTGFVVKNFSLMYIVISMIYVIAAIFMINSDMINEARRIEAEIKKQEEEAKLKREEEEKKEAIEREKERQKRKEAKDREKEQKKKEKSKDVPEPEGTKA